MQVHGGVCRWSWLTLPALPYDAPSPPADEGTNSEQRRDSRNRRRHEKGLYL